MLFRRDLVIFALSSVLCGPQAQALIIGGTLLDETGATLIESQIGLGELDFVNIFSGGTNASATSWHAAVDDTWPSVSIYSIMDPSTQLRYLIGGYSTVSWAGSGYVHDPTAFIFNLTSSTVRPLNPNMPYAGFSVYRDPSYFATYGGGHDIYGGSLSVGNGGYAYEGYSYGTPFTTNIVNGSAGRLDFTVDRLETFTLRSVAVPEPATLALLGTGLLGLLIRRRRAHGA